MPFKRTTLRYAHTSGHAHCCYVDGGEFVITTGRDGDIRIWHGIDDDDPNTRCVGEFVLYHVYYDNRILVSTDMNTVQAYTYPDGDRDGTEFRFTAAVTCIKVNEKYIAACSEDMTIKVVPRDKSTEYFEFTEHEGPVLRIDLSCNGLLASSSGDGTIKIWQLNERKLVKTLAGFDKVKSYEGTEVFVTPSFEPKRGKFMAYNKGKEIVIVDTSNWEVKKKLSDENVDAVFSVCGYSPCGSYIAAGGTNGEIVVWDIETNKLIREENNSDCDAQCIAAIDWNPTNNGEFAYTDNTGQLGLIVNIFEGDHDDANDEEMTSIADDNGIDFDGIEFPDDPEDTENENCVSLEKLKNETMRKTAEDEIDDILDAQSTRTDDDAATDIDKAMAPASFARTYAMQAPFQPGSTSPSLEHRYMMWNHVGIVRQHMTSSDNSIEVEFHDATVHHSLHLVNHMHHTMASLSTSVLALCCETPSKLVCIALGGAGGSREWAMPMPNCEEICCVAASDKLVAVATDARFLRVFSAMGTQRECLSLAGPVVALAAHSDRILAVYHSTPPVSDDQQLSVLLVQTIGMSLRGRDVKIALTPGAKLAWIGYTDRGSPATCDSMGMVRIFSMRSNLWFPVCDTSTHTKGASDTFFIVEVSESTQIVRAILCRGASYPFTTPRPMVNELKMQLPSCDIENDQTRLEEQLVRYSNFNVDGADQILKENALKLFSLACRSEMEARAKELIEMIASPELLPLAIKYASKLGRMHLAEKLGELLPQFEEKAKERELYDENEEASDLLLSVPVIAQNLIQANKNSSPAFVPKPLSISQTKRNPFKKTPDASRRAVSNPLKHLTDSALGYDSQETDTDSQVVADSQPDSVTASATTNGKENHSTKANPSATKPTFLAWYNGHKAKLQSEQPDLIPSELTKYAMGKYREIYSAGTNGSAATFKTDGAATAKRKIENENGNEPSNGVAKLAKFNFTK